MLRAGRQFSDKGDRLDLALRPAGCLQSLLQQHAETTDGGSLYEASVYELIALYL